MLITKFKLLISMCIYFACMPSVVDAETYYPGAGGRMGIIDYYTDEEPKSEPVPAAYGDVFEPIKSVCSCSEKALPVIEQDLLKKMKGRLQVQIEQDLSSNYISGIHLIKKSVEQFIRSVVA